jgi:hypothetical protein
MLVFFAACLCLCVAAAAVQLHRILAAAFKAADAAGAAGAAATIAVNAHLLTAIALAVECIHLYIL